MIRATHFIDSHYFMIRMSDCYTGFLINGNKYERRSSNRNIVVKGDELEIRTISETRYIAYYKHRESDIKLSVEEYSRIQKGYRENGSYKSLEDEFASRKMENDYVPCYATEEIISDPIAIEIENAIEFPDCRYIKPLYTIPNTYANDKDWGFILFEYDAFADFSEWVQAYMKELGIPSREEYSDDKADGEFYVLNKITDYSKFSLSGFKYIIVDDYFTKNGKIVGRFEEIKVRREELMPQLKSLIDRYVDKMRIKPVKKSTIKKLEELYADVSKSKAYRPLSNRLAGIINEINDKELSKK